MKKRIVTLLISLVLALTTFQLPLVHVLAAGEPDLLAVSPSPWAQEYVQKSMFYELADESLYSNYGTQITRQELFETGVIFYEKMTGTEATPAAVNPYEDIDDPEIMKAVGLELTREFPAGKFGPSEPAVRGDVVLLLYNISKACAPELDLDTETELLFEDADSIGEAMLNAAKYTAANGILRGKPGNILDLSTVCSRQEFIAFIIRTYEFLMQETGKASKGLLWEVKGGNSSVYLLGSIHIADKSLYPLDNSIEEAFAASDYLAVEANVMEDAEGILYMQSKAMFTDGSTLEMHVSPETYALFVEKMQAYGFGPEMYGTLKPWFAAMLLQNLSMLGGEANYSANLGIDVYFLAGAANRKEILQVESIRFQVDLFDSLSADLQEQFLLSTLSSATVENEEGASVQEALLEYMLTAWKEGNAQEMEEIIQATEQSEVNKEFYEIFINERNNHMTDVVKSYLSDVTGKTYFVVVGAAHLVGETGIVKQLTEQGYTVERILD